MDTVLGVSMAPTAVRMVLVEGENADGVTVDEDGFDVNVAADAPTINAADQVVPNRNGADGAGVDAARICAVAAIEVAANSHVAYSLIAKDKGAVVSAGAANDAAVDYDGSRDGAIVGVDIPAVIVS